MRMVIMSLSGALVGAVTSVMLGPSFLTYWATPPFQIPGCDYRPAINWAMHYLLVTQAAFIVIGAVLVPVIFGFVFRGFRIGICDLGFFWVLDFHSH